MKPTAERRPSKFAAHVARRVTCPKCGKLQTRVSRKGKILSHSAYMGWWTQCSAVGLILPLEER